MREVTEKRTAATAAVPDGRSHTVTGHVVGDICFACECRILELAGDEGMVLAWCECGWPDDAAEMEVLG
jgi:hypothetical protein